MNKTFKLDSQIAKFEVQNSLFSKVKIKIAYDGINRNNSYISKETFEKAIPSIYNCPILGEYNESIEDFRGHGGKLEISDNQIKWIQTTKPYGVIDANSEITWEDVTDDGGNVKQYLCATGYLWTGRYPELNQVVENSKSQSMELEVKSGKQITYNNQKCYEITEFEFSGFCILGDDIEPCFEDSTISSYSMFDKDQFTSEFKQMLKELKFSLNKNIGVSTPDIYNASIVEEGGKSVPEDIIAMLEKYGLTSEQLIENEVNYEDYSPDDLEAKVKEVFEIMDEHVIDPEQQVFSLTAEQLEDELQRELCEVEVMSDPYYEDYTYPRYWYRDNIPDESAVIAWDCKNSYLVGGKYSVQGDNVEVDASTFIRYKYNYTPMDLGSDMDEGGMFTFVPQEIVDGRMKRKEAEIQQSFSVDKDSTVQELQAKYDELQSKYKLIKDELDAKKQQEREEDEEALFTQYSTVLSEEDINEVKESKHNFSLQEIENQLKLKFAEKNLKFSLNPEIKDKTARFNLGVDTKPISNKPYAELIESRKKS